MKVRISNAITATHQEDGSTFLDVEYQIISDQNKVLEVRRRAFPTDVKVKTITESISRELQVYIDELALAEASKEKEAEQAAIDETINQITGKDLDEIVSETEPEEENKENKNEI